MKITHRLEPGPVHTTLTLWADGKNIGTLTVGNDEKEVLDSIVNSFSNVQALKQIGDIVAQVPTPNELEFGREWPMRCEHIAVQIGTLVHKALGGPEPTTEERAAFERACAWLDSFAKEQSRVGADDGRSTKEQRDGAVRAQGVRDAAEQMSRALLS